MKQYKYSNRFRDCLTIKSSIIDELFWLASFGSNRVTS